MNLFNIKTLAKIAAIGGFGVGISGYYFRNSIENNLKKSEYYTESFKILRSNPGIAHFMGAPIYDGRIDLGDNENNYCTGKEAKFEIPVRGSKKKGTFYIFASRKEISDNWTIDRLELGVDDIPGKRILIVAMAEGEDYSDLKMNNSVSNQCSSSDSMSHAELTRLFQQTLKQMVVNDPLLKGLHEQVTLEEVEAVLALERGQAITIFVERNNGEPWKIVVSQNATVYQFKLALKHHAALYLARQGNIRKLSWKHIWRIYDLCFNGTRITDDNKKLQSYGLMNKSTLIFSKKLKKPLED